MSAGKVEGWAPGSGEDQGGSVQAGPLHSSLLTPVSPRPVPEPVPRGARGSMPAGVPGGPEPLPQLPEMPEPSFGESHSPHLPQPQVRRQGRGVGVGVQLILLRPKHQWTVPWGTLLETLRGGPHGGALPGE